MRIVGIGAGPASLYAAILMKRAFPQVEVELVERNRPDDTFGWGVVFSDETLSGFEEADAPSYRAIENAFVSWTDIDTFVGGTCVRSTGHGFVGLSRQRLLQILHARARELEVKLTFETEVIDPTPYREGADLLLAGDGVRSVVREAWADHFQPQLDWRRCKFAWLGTTMPLDAFTFVFAENEHGLFQVHAYPFQRGEGETLSTWIVECQEEAWLAAGLDKASEADTVAYMQKLYEPYLDGHPLLTNRSVWRTFPTVRNASWHHENVVLIGDAAHTAHFSIGSGTKLAMEDAVALTAAFQAHGLDDVPRALAAYEAARRDDVSRLQHAAQTSLEWFENSPRYLGQSPTRFTFNLMTRSKRITYDNLARRDPDIVERITDEVAAETGARVIDGYDAPPPAYTPFSLRDLTLANRIVVSPMCQYMATDGVPDDWHLVHLGSLALGSPGLLMTEMTNVSAEGCITTGCTGLWNDEQEAGWARVLAFVRAQTDVPMGLQMGHAGRKGSCSLPWEGDRPLEGDAAWTCTAASAAPFGPGWPTPREATANDLAAWIEAYVQATQRAERLGFDLIEVHMAHGYLLSGFLSPLSNHRTDAYGGDIEGRMRFPLEVFRAMRAAWPDHKPMSVRVSATDWMDDQGGQTVADSVVLAKALKAEGCDIIDVSSAGNDPRSRVVYGRMYQVPFAEQIRYEAEMPVMAVGGIQGWDHANTLVAAGRADLCAIARAHLLNPHLTLAGSAAYRETSTTWPRPYQAARPKPQTREERRNRQRR